MNKIINPIKAKFGGCVLLLILIAEYIFVNFHIAAWPAMVCMVFFMLMGEKKEEFSKILFGGLLGIGTILIDPFIVRELTPIFGASLARIVFILLFVACIILFKEVLPWVFNTYSFMFLLFASQAIKLPNASPIMWMATELIGGASIMGILYFLSQKFSHNASASAIHCAKEEINNYDLKY